MSDTDIKDDLEKRVEQFNALELPGQPQGMHMGTMYLVGDLMREVKRLRAGRAAVWADCRETCAKVAELYVSLMDSHGMDHDTFGGLVANGTLAEQIRALEVPNE